TKIDFSSSQLVKERNELKNKILGIDKSLREIYSVIMTREEDKRRGHATEELARQATIAKARAKENESTQRQQWTGNSAKQKFEIKEKDQISKSKKDFVEKLKQSTELEQQQREKFMKDVEGLMESKDHPLIPSVPLAARENRISPVQRAQENSSRPIPPPPPKKN
ncbi:MAG: hypothetical protein NT094_02175, partial [Candidatus Staskawiczbacteria bacterium]|nr:hypothetical protein [Candidatus Staskawiczbacteria bacterium]